MDHVDDGFLMVGASEHGTDAKWTRRLGVYQSFYDVSWWMMIDHELERINQQSQPTTILVNMVDDG